MYELNNYDFYISLFKQIQKCNILNNIDKKEKLNIIINTININRNIAEHHIFIYACYSGDFEFAKYIINEIFSINSSIRRSVYFTYGFLYACVEGHLNIIKWMYTENNKLIDTIIIKHKRQLQHIFSNGNLDTVQWLLNTNRILIQLIHNDLIIQIYENSHSNMVKWLIDQKYLDENIVDLSSLCEYFCDLGCIDVVKSLFINYPCIQINFHELFTNVCKNNYYELAKWMFTNIKNDIDVSKDNEYLFRYSCENGHIEIVKLLIKINPNINISVNEEYSFKYACANGHLKIAKLLLSLKPDINVNIDNCLAFNLACISGKLDVIKWLFTINKNITLTKNTFYYTCRNGQLSTIKWLMKNMPEHINIYEKNDRAIKMACKNKLMEIAKFLVSINPDRYRICSSNDIKQHIWCFVTE